MRKMIFPTLALILAALTGCGRNSDSGKTAGATQASGGGGGLSLYPLSSGVAANGQNAYPGQILPQSAVWPDQPRAAPLAAPRQPSPYESLLAGRSQPYAVNQQASNPLAISTNLAQPVMIPSVISAGTVAADGGVIRLIPALDVQPGVHAGDVTPSQWFEIVHPASEPLRIGRLSTTCGCIMARAPKRQVPAGERALIEVRTLTRPPVNHITYGLYVGVLEPEKLTLDIDVTVNY